MEYFIFLTQITIVMKKLPLLLFCFLLYSFCFSQTDDKCGDGIYLIRLNDSSKDFTVNLKNGNLNFSSDSVGIVKSFSEFIYMKDFSIYVEDEIQYIEYIKHEFINAFGSYGYLLISQTDMAFTYDVSFPPVYFTILKTTKN